MPWWLWIVLFIVGFYAICGVVDRYPALKRRRARRVKCVNGTGAEIAVPEPGQPVYETYGHPWAPIPELVAKLPCPPTNYSWEITALLNSYGSPALRLALLDLRTTEVSDFIERDLVVIRRWRYAEDDTFASFYRRARDQVQYLNSADALEAILRKVFYAHLLAPLADWATATAASKVITEPPALVSNYRLVQGQVA